MARPSSTTVPDTARAHELTSGMIERLICPPGKGQVFLRDSKAPGLRVRVTAGGAKSFVFEAKLNRQTIRRTIGDVRTWDINDARIEARRQGVLLDGGVDPRELERQENATKTAAAAKEASEAVTFGQAWVEYLVERRPLWGDLHAADHVRLSKAGGIEAKRGTRGRGVTVAGPINTLLPIPLRDLDAATFEAWAAKEAETRPTTARLAWRLVKVFLSWCAEQPRYADLLPAVNPAKTKRTRESLGPAVAKKDALLREQLPAWFAAVRGLRSTETAAYLQTMLLTGGRPNEVLALRWEDLNLQWRGITIRDKVEGARVIPLTPYVWSLLAPLPRRTGWVFSSPQLAATDPHGNRQWLDQPMGPPHKAMADACVVAGVSGLTLHGLRRSFKSLTEWLDIPAGVVAQLMGHKPSATAEKHYTVRPLDLLRVHHQKIEAWILEQAEGGVQAGGGGASLRVVAAA